LIIDRVLSVSPLEVTASAGLVPFPDEELFLGKADKAGDLSL